MDLRNLNYVFRLQNYRKTLLISNYDVSKMYRYIAKCIISYFFSIICNVLIHKIR